MSMCEEIYNDAFNNELEKIALSAKTLTSAARKAALHSSKLQQANEIIGGVKRFSTRSSCANYLNGVRGNINKAISKSRMAIDKKSIRSVAKDRLLIRKADKILLSNAI